MLDEMLTAKIIIVVVTKDIKDHCLCSLTLLGENHHFIQ